jgi:hypothetical protein
MRRFALIFLVLSCFGAGEALAASGKAVGVNPSATDEVKTVSRDLVVGSDVGIGDKIVTGPAGQVQLLFTDDTRLVVGPSSSLVVESYLLRGDKSVGQFALNALGGSFRFITGKSDHSAYAINTPTGTIGVRGTAFDFLVDPDKGILPGKKPGTTVTLFRGEVLLCNLEKVCVTLSHKCQVGAITLPESFKIGTIQAADDGFRSKFNYVDSQKPLLPDFRLDEARFCFLDTSNTGNSLSSFSGGAEPPPPPVNTGEGGGDSGG